MPDTGVPKGAGSQGVASLLRANPVFGRLWTARLLSFAGDSVGLIALMLYTAERFGTGLAVALLLIAGDFVPGLLSPVVGVVSDRLDRRAVMVGCELVQGIVVSAIALILPGLPLLLLLVGVQACVAAVLQPASRSAVPDLVGDSDLERANAAIGFGTNGMDGFAPLAGAALLAWLSVRDLLLVDSASFAISAGLLVALPALRPRSADKGQARRGRTFADARAGLEYLWRDELLRILTLLFCVVVLFNAIDDVALVFLAKHALHGSNSAASLVYAGAGLGMLAGFWFLARNRLPVALPVLVVVGYAVTSLGNLLTGTAAVVLAALAFQTVRGLGIAAIDVGQNTLIQRVVPAGLLGRTFGNFAGAIGVAAGFSYIVGGLLLDATGPRVTLIVAGSGGLAAAALASFLLPRAAKLAARRSLATPP